MKPKTVRLDAFIENPDNPQTVMDDAFALLVDSLRNTPETLAVSKIAYVTDYVALDGTDLRGQRVVIAGNKRLRALKQIASHGGLASADGEAWHVTPRGDVPADWFYDLTPLGKEAREAWLVKSNIQSGEWDAEKLLALYPQEDLAALMGDDAINELLGSVSESSAEDDSDNQDTTGEYQKFVDKFKTKLTTDDCYTPENIYEAVAAHVAQTYKLDRAAFVRPFWPGGDYESFDYPPGCCVVDNPPFSILSKIVRFYQERDIDFFLFAPALTLFNIASGSAKYIACAVDVTYKNGAVVSTSFVTSLGSAKVASCPALYAALKAANDANATAAELPRYEYPLELITPTRLAYFSKYGIDFKADAASLAFVRALDAQTDSGIFGGGFLVSQKAAAEKAAAKVFELSPRERKIIEGLA